jgi:hypothetical protein
MNRLGTAKRVQIVSALAEGMSLRSTSRMSDVSINAVTKLLVDMGSAKKITLEQKQAGWGDAWTWTAIDANTKLCVSYLVGGRSTGWAMGLMEDCSQRIVGHPRITTVALYFMHSNFCRAHKTLRVTPATEAGLADHVWSLEELVGLLDGAQRVAA